MKEQEDNFLRKAFVEYKSIESPGIDFNQKILREIEINQVNSILIHKFLRIYIPVLILCLSVGTFLLFSYENAIFSFLQGVIPLLKPWHLMLVIGFIYFHFVRSILFLAFIYIKKQFNVAIFLPSFLR